MGIPQFFVMALMIGLVVILGAWHLWAGAIAALVVFKGVRFLWREIHTPVEEWAR